MALLWEKITASAHYEVKSAGHSVRLYTNGVFHSQWNPRHPIIGQLWELLFLPAVLLEKPKDLRILVLGVGGGTVINLLYHFLSVKNLIGVELDRTHLQVARRWFKSNKPGVKFIHAEAKSWLQAYRGPAFDYIIEDLFKSDENGEVLRAFEADSEWLALLTANLKDKGVLTMNFESVKKAKRAWANAARQTCHLTGVLLLSRRNENAVACFSRQSFGISDLKKSLTSHRELNIQAATCRLDVNFRKLKS